MSDKLIIQGDNETVIYCSECRKRLLKISTKRATFSIHCTNCDTSTDFVIPMEVEDKELLAYLKQKYGKDNVEWKLFEWLEDSE